MCIRDSYNYNFIIIYDYDYDDDDDDDDITGEPKAIPYTHATPIKCAVDEYLQLFYHNYI